MRNIPVTVLYILVNRTINY